jgi:hypothetical protein
MPVTLQTEFTRDIPPGTVTVTVTVVFAHSRFHDKPIPVAMQDECAPSLR